jgi:lipoprotein-anchoring transpeptidase ErfK/SrfK
MMKQLSRRGFLGGMAGALGVVAGTSVAGANPFYDDGRVARPYDTFTRDPSLIPPNESPIDYPIERVDPDTIKRKFQRQLVVWDGEEGPGTIVVDPAERFLYYVLDETTAVRYGVGVGRSGFAWSGEAYIGMKRKWPRWMPPDEMVARDLKAAVWANGMPGGPTNPLGARALYLHNNGEDTMFRIHGTTEPHSIGKAMSSGCIRMLNQDVAELYELVPVKTRVIVLSAEEA